MKPDSPPEDEPRQWARAVSPEAFDALTELMRQSESLPTKIAAIKEILDRGYGRTPLAGGGDAEAPQPIFILHKDTLWPNDPSKAIPDPARR